MKTIDKVNRSQVWLSLRFDFLFHGCIMFVVMWSGHDVDGCLGNTDLEKSITNGLTNKD